MEKSELTYDVIFCDDEKSQSMGFAASFDFCKDYIERNNGSENGLFPNYKGWGCLIVCIQDPGRAYYTADVL